VKEYLKNISKELKNYSKSLDKISILIDKPWAVIDVELEMQKLIFKKDKSLIMSKNGKVTKGTWDYLPEANSIIIDRINDQILCNAAFIDDVVLILKLDGTSNDFFALANENKLQDLNIIGYFNDILYKQERLLETKQEIELDKAALEKQTKADNEVLLWIFLVFALMGLLGFVIFIMQ
jgi:hypothetical protein